MLVYFDERVSQERVSKMNVPKVTDGELNILEVLWDSGPLKATDIVKSMYALKNWNRNTTYTFINRLVEKKIVAREEPGFICSALYTREEVGSSETKDFVNKMFMGSYRRLVSAFLNSGDVEEDDIKAIEEMLKKKRE